MRCNDCEAIFDEMGSCESSLGGMMMTLLKLIKYDEPHLECPSQEEGQVPGEAESLVEGEDLVGVVASNWLALVANHLNWLVLVENVGRGGCHLLDADQDH